MSGLGIGLRSGIGLLTVLVLVYFGVYVGSVGNQQVALAVYVLAGLRTLLLGYDLYKYRRRQQAVAAEAEAEVQPLPTTRPPGGGEGPAPEDEPPSANPAPPAA